MAEHFAWAPITAPDTVKGKGAFLTIPAGDKVSKSQIGDKDWDTLIAAGVIRTRPYPTDIRHTESPRTAQLRKANDEMKRLQDPFAHELDEEVDDGGDSS